MGSATKATLRSSPPLSLRSQKGMARQSPMSRLRSRSYSHDKDLYRMGLRKNAAEEWAVPATSRVPAALADAMRRMRIRSATRVKREPTKDSDVNMLDATDDFEYVGDGVVDLTDPKEVYEEIRYLDVEKEIDGGLVYVNAAGAEMETVMRSVESKADFKMDMEDVKMVGPGFGAGGVVRSNAVRESLTSIAEDEENSMKQVPPVVKKGKKWTDPEIHYVGALLDAGYKPADIVGPFRARYYREITKKSITNCQKRHFRKIKYVEQSRLLGQELGLERGKCSEIEATILFRDQETERQAVIEKQQQELEAGNAKLLASLDAKTRLEMHFKMNEMFIAQRAKWHDLIVGQYQRRCNSGLRFDWHVKCGIGHLVPLTILVYQSKTRCTTSEDTMNQYVYPTEYGQSSEWGRFCHDIGDIKDYNRLLAYKYHIAMLLLEEEHGLVPKLDYHRKAVDLLLFDEESIDRFIIPHKWKELHKSRRRLCEQQNERSRVFEQQKADTAGLLSEAEGTQDIAPFQALELVDLLSGSLIEQEMMDLFLAVEESGKLQLEATLRAGKAAIELVLDGTDYYSQKNSMICHTVWDYKHQKEKEALHDQQIQQRALFKQQRETDPSSISNAEPLEASSIMNFVSDSQVYHAIIKGMITSDEDEKLRIETGLRAIMGRVLNNECKYKNFELCALWRESCKRQSVKDAMMKQDKQNLSIVQQEQPSAPSSTAIVSALWDPLQRARAPSPEASEAFRPDSLHWLLDNASREGPANSSPWEQAELEPPQMQYSASQDNWRDLNLNPVEAMTVNLADIGMVLDMNMYKEGNYPNALLDSTEVWAEIV